MPFVIVCNSQFISIFTSIVCRHSFLYIIFCCILFQVTAYELVSVTYIYALLLFCMTIFVGIRSTIWNIQTPRHIYNFDDASIKNMENFCVWRVGKNTPPGFLTTYCVRACMRIPNSIIILTARFFIILLFCTSFLNVIYFLSLLR